MYDVTIVYISMYVCVCVYVCVRVRVCACVYVIWCRYLKTNGAASSFLMIICANLMV